MAFETSWNGIGANLGVIRITGDDARYRIKWGDGGDEVVRKDRDEDGDGVPDSANPLHVYGQDGTYDVTVTQLQAGLPPVHMKAFMYASAANDLSIGGSYLQDIMVGGTGNDDLRGAGGSDTLAGNDGNDRLNGGAGDDFLLGGQGLDTVLGGSGSDLLGGNEGDDVLRGGADRDYVYGDAGNDQLFGDDGDDYLNGGAGVDRLTGGAGADTFVIGRPQDANGDPLPSDPDHDTVTDFQQGTDQIGVYDWFGGNLNFVGDGAFTGAGDEIRFVRTAGATVIFGDADGDKVADFSLRIDAGITPTAADFYG